MHKIVTGLLLFFILFPILAQGVNPVAAEDGETQEPIKVVTKDIEPFVLWMGRKLVALVLTYGGHWPLNWTFHLNLKS